MKAKSLLVLAAAVLILGAFIWFFERHQPTSDEARAYDARVFGDLDQESVVAMDITNVHGSFSLHRDHAGWRLTHPVQYDADPTAVEAALRALVQLDRDRTLGPEEVDPEVYGLDRPDTTVTLTQRGGRTHSLTIGDPTPLDSKRAVSIDAESVILTNGDFFATLDKALDGWRSREVAHVTLDQLAALSLRTGNHTIEAARLDGIWHLLAPVDDRADQDHLQNLISGLNGLRVEEFVDQDIDPALMGLIEPDTSVLAVMADGSPGLSLEFGTTRNNNGATQIACRRNQADVFWVNDRAVNALGKAAVLWRDPTVLAFETWNVTALTLSEGSATVQLTKENGLWRLDDGTEAQSEEVMERLDALAQLKAVDFDLLELGTPKMGRAVVTLNGDEVPLTVTFFESLEAGGNALVTVSGRNTVMSVAADSVQSIIGNLQALRPDQPALEEAAPLGLQGTSQ